MPDTHAASRLSFCVHAVKYEGKMENLWGQSQKSSWSTVICLVQRLSVRYKEHVSKVMIKKEGIWFVEISWCYEHFCLVRCNTADLEGHQYFDGTCCLHLHLQDALEMEVTYW